MTDLDKTANQAPGTSTSDDASSASKKRARPLVEVGDDERQRLRDKNRTNSKRFRDRKKNFMDGLFEEKYRLGKTNNELREENEKLRVLFEEALAENEMHRRNAALGLYKVEPVVAPTVSPLLLNAGAALGHSVLGLHHHHALASAAQPALDLLSQSMQQPSKPSLLGLLEEVGAQKRKRMIDDLALQDLEDTIKAKIVTSARPTVAHQRLF